MSIPDTGVLANVVFLDRERTAVMKETLDLRVQECDRAFFVLCPYDLTGLDAPELGPYPTFELASRAQAEIFASVTGNCA